MDHRSRVQNSKKPFDFGLRTPSKEVFKCILQKTDLLFSYRKRIICILFNAIDFLCGFGCLQLHLDCFLPICIPIMCHFSKSSFQQIDKNIRNKQEQTSTYCSTHAAEQQMTTRMSITTPTVKKILGAVDSSSFCHGSIAEFRSKLPIRYLGITFSFAFLEWLACSKASEAFLPALLSNTMGPPGCSLEYCVRSQTLSLITTQRSVSVLCFPTSCQVQIFYVIC